MAILSCQAKNQGYEHQGKPWIRYASASGQKVLQETASRAQGLTESEVLEHRAVYGVNSIAARAAGWLSIRLRLKSEAGLSEWKL